MSVLRRSLLAATTAAALALPLTGFAQATVDVGGVKYDTSAQVGNAKLVLNGAGVRYKAIFKVYTAGLYLPAKTGAVDAAISTASPRRMHIVMLRDIDGNELGKLFTRGMQDNASKEEFAKSIPGTIRMGEIFATRKKLVSGDFFTIDFVPGTGTVISVNGKPQLDPIKEPEFYTALMRIWLGHQPADNQLKDALLGKQAPARAGGPQEG